MSRLGLCASRRYLLYVLAAIQYTVSVHAADAAVHRFRIRLSEAVATQPFSGRVYIFFSEKMLREPRLDFKFIKAEPFIALDVENWKPGETVTLASDKSEDILSFPVPLWEMNLAGFRAQAVVRLNPFAQEIGGGEGNGYSRAVALPSEDSRGALLNLVVDQVVPKYRFTETKWCKLLQVRSKLLSDFHGRDVTVNAAVVLPASYYEQPDRRYPTIFDIPGFFGSHHRGMTDHPNEDQDEQGVEFLRVMLDGTCPMGHHMFADSTNNGRYGSAFIQEFLPAFDNEFRSLSQPSARFLTGFSTGAWSSLWLQINYPGHFAGAWADAPDPVDFRDFQRINIYAPNQNMYHDSLGAPRPLAHTEDRVLLYFKELAQLELVQGHGGQLQSFEAVFSPRGNDGKPLPLWNRETGAIDSDVAKTWEKYDLRLILERNWKTLAPKLQGKLHIHTNESESYYLEGAVKLLKDTLEELGSDAEIVIHPGHDHGAMSAPEEQRKILREMVAVFLRNHPDKAAR